MKVPQLLKRKWNYLAVAFLMPVTALIILMIWVGATPFGSSSLLYSDEWHQYFPFFKAYREAILRGDSLLYSWNVGMGMDYLGLISYYLASPLYWLSVLLPDYAVLPYFSLLMPIKLGLASLFFAIFLKRTFGKDDFSIALFGSFYALCAWALGYQWNIMWLDTFALLPLVALGTISLLRDKKFILYTITLALSIYANYYIGFFTCIFVLLTFICYQICNCKSVKRFFLDLVRIGLFSVLAIAMTAILTLPTLAALKNTYSSVNTYPQGFELNMVDYNFCAPAREAWEAFKQAKEQGSPAIGLWFVAVGKSFAPVINGMGQAAGNLAGGGVPSFMEGLPNVYSGISTLLLSFLFLMARNVKLREKLCCIFLLLFFMLSFVIRQLDYIWHGFHFTNMIPYRFSFLYSFVMLYMAYRAYIVRHRFKPLHLALATLLTIEVLLLSKYCKTVPAAVASLGDVFRLIGQILAGATAGNAAASQAAAAALNNIYAVYGTTYVFLAFNIVFLGLTLTVLLYPALRKKLPADMDKEAKREYITSLKNRRSLATGLLSLVMVLELVMNVVNFGVNFSYTNIENYPQGTEYTASMIRYMKEREKSLFYRAETTHTQTLNDGALNDYNGISTFSSSANVKVTEFMTAMGYAAQNNWNRYCFEESSPVANLFLNLKYMLERDGRVEENPYFTDVHHYGDVHLLENNAYLPLGFLAEKNLADVELVKAGFNTFANQNAMFQAATGIEENVWNNTHSSWLTFESQGVDITSQSDIGFCYYNVPGASGTLIFRYTIGEEGFLCMDINMPAQNYFYVYLNGSYLFGDGITLSQSIAVGQVKPGDVVEIRAYCKGGEDSWMQIRAAQLNDEVFQRGYEILKASTLELTEFENDHFVGTINCNRDGLMYTSVPDDGNWIVKVDGEEAEIVLVGDAMIGVNLSQGQHEIEFTYKNKSFTYGALITTAAVIVFLALIYYYDREKWNERFVKLYNSVTSKFKRK